MKILQDDDELPYPRSICTACLNQAATSYNFKLQCVRTNFILDQYLNTTKLKQVKFDNVEQNNHVSLKCKQKNTSPEQELEKSYARAEEAAVTEILNCQDENKFSMINSISEDDKDAKVDNNKNKCSRKTVMEGLAEYHKKKSKTGNTNELEKLHFCSTCNKSFTNKYVFHAHKKRHEFKGQFLCNVCGKGFNSKSCLTRHTRVHTGERKYICPICHKKFPSSNNLNLHSRTHSGHKPYLCTVCGKNFSHPTGLTYHMRTHTKEKPYSCDVCGKQFAIQCHVVRHKKTHSGLF